MLLKGYGLSLNYPYPSFRPVGDIDIFLFKEESQDGAVGADGSSSDPRPVWQRADDMVASVLQATIDPSHDHHTIFHVEGITVENHYDFTVLTHHKSNLPLERTLKELALDHSHQTYIGDQKIYLPSPQLNALFLLRHTAGHFAAYGLRLRQVLDWAFFIKSMADPQSSDAVSAGSKKEGNIMDLPTLWQWLIPQAQQYGLDRFLAILNQVCVENLGFDKGLFPSLPYDKKMKDRVLQSILKGTEPEPTCLPIFLPFARTINWCRHWWKHKLCYPESFFPALITQIHTNLTHPPSPTFQEKR